MQLHPIKTLSLVRVFIVWLLCPLQSLHVDTQILWTEGEVQMDALKLDSIKHPQMITLMQNHFYRVWVVYVCGYMCVYVHISAQCMGDKGLSQC